MEGLQISDFVEGGWSACWGDEDWTVLFSVDRGLEDMPLVGCIPKIVKGSRSEKPGGSI